MDFRVLHGPELWAIDLDRTLLNTERAFEHLVSAATDVTAFSESELQAAKLETEATGGSFDVLGFLGRQGVGSQTVDEIREQFAQNFQQDKMLYDDALPLLARLDHNRIPSLIITYGAFEWQYAKLQATGLDKRPHLITNHKNKGEVIDGWRRQSSYYGVETTSGAYLLAPTVKLIDDKADSFEGLPADCSGHLIERPGETRLASQQGLLLPNVSLATSLWELRPAKRLRF